MGPVTQVAAEEDGDGPDASASISMKTSQRTSGGVETQRDERYPEELGSMRLCHLHDLRSVGQEVTARIQAPTEEWGPPTPWRWY